MDLGAVDLSLRERLKVASDARRAEREKREKAERDHKGRLALRELERAEPSGGSRIADFGFYPIKRQTQLLRRDDREHGARAGADILGADSNLDGAVAIRDHLRLRARHSCRVPAHVEHVNLRAGAQRSHRAC